jgi:type I restriction enzyme S subunit
MILLKQSNLSKKWSSVCLSEVVDFLDHLRKPITEKDRTPGAYPYYGANGQQDSIAEYLFDEPLILLAEDGGHFGDPSKTIAYQVNEKCWVNNHAHVLRPRTNVDIRYLCRHLERYDVTPFVTGSTRGKLTKGAASRIPILLPPLEEQKRIAAILDRADAIRRKRKEAIALTEELLRSTFLDMFGDPVTNPKGWDEEPLGKIATFIGGGTPSRKNPKYYNGTICWASSKDMSDDILKDTEEHITQEAIENSSTKLVDKGVLLVVVKSKILMRRLPVARTEVATCFNQDIKAIVPQDISIKRYLHQHLKLGQETLLKQARGVNTEGLTLDHLRNYKVMIPPILLLKKFVEFQKSLESSLRNNDRANQVSQNLFNSLLQKAFRGEL